MLRVTVRVATVTTGRAAKCLLLGLLLSVWTRWAVLQLLRIGTRTLTRMVLKPLCCIWLMVIRLLIVLAILMFLSWSSLVVNL